MPERKIGEATAALCVVCAAFTFALWAAPGNPRLESIVKLMAVPGLVYGGGYWRLITAILLHNGFIHLILNVMFLWRVGSAFENTVGSFPFVVFVVFSGFVSMGLQLTFSQSGGPVLGISGVVCALFGFAWQARSHFTHFQMIASDRSVKFVLIILTLFWALTAVGLAHIANVAHFAGLGFGMAVAWALVPNEPLRHRLGGWFCVVLLIAFTSTSLVWAPWSKNFKAYKMAQAAARRREMEAERLERFLREIEKRRARESTQEEDSPETDGTPSTSK